MNYAENDHGERVRFERPRWKQIREEGLTAVDMHFHTNHSDSYTDIRKAVRLAEKRGIGFAVTDHNVIGGAAEALKIKTDIMIIPGIEISAWDGPHILAYFYDMDSLREYWTKNIKEMVPKSPSLAIKADTEWILNSLESENCIVSAAHPMGYIGFNKGIQKCINRGYLDEGITKRLDAYEVICSGMTHENNILAKECADRYDLGYTGGTDGHMLKEVGNVVTISEGQDIEGFLNSVKERTNCIVGIEKDLKTKVEMGMMAFAQYMHYIPSSLAIHYKQNKVRVKHYAKQKRNK